MALQEVTMPAMGADMTEGTVVKWLKSEGDAVARGDKLAEIETDKTVVEMESYSEGILRQIILGDGSKVPVGTLLAYVGDLEDALPVGVEDVSEPAEQTETTEEPEGSDEVAQAEAEEGQEITAAFSDEVPDQVSETDEAETVASEPETSSPGPAPSEPAPVVADVSPDDMPAGRVKASPLARRLAREAGYDIAAIVGTGPGGRVTRDDVLAFTPEPEPVEVPVVSIPEEPVVEPADEPSAPEPPSVEVEGTDIELTSMRLAIARVTTRSKTEAPHYYVTTGIDMTDAMSFRTQYNAEIEESGDRVSVNDMLIKALSMALVKYPKWNSFYGDGKLEGHSSVNIGVAIALEAGLIVPALIGVHGMSLVEVSRAAKDLGNRARGNGGTLTQEELTEGTFSTSNLGMFDIDVFSAIIVPPQAGILAVGSAKPTPVVRDGDIVVRTIMNATISADHRVGDGAEAAVLLNEVKSNLERPLRLII